MKKIYGQMDEGLSILVTVNKTHSEIIEKYIPYRITDFWIEEGKYLEIEKWKECNENLIPVLCVLFLHLYHGKKNGLDISEKLNSKHKKQIDEFLSVANSLNNGEKLQSIKLTIAGTTYEINNDELLKTFFRDTILKMEAYAEWTRTEKEIQTAQTPRFITCYNLLLEIGVSKTTAWCLIDRLYLLSGIDDESKFGTHGKCGDRTRKRIENHFKK